MASPVNCINFLDPFAHKELIPMSITLSPIIIYINFFHYLISISDLHQFSAFCSIPSKLYTTQYHPVHNKLFLLGTMPWPRQLHRVGLSSLLQAHGTHRLPTSVQPPSLGSPRLATSWGELFLQLLLRGQAKPPPPGAMTGTERPPAPRVEKQTQRENPALEVLGSGPRGGRPLLHPWQLREDSCLGVSSKCSRQCKSIEHTSLAGFSFPSRTHL